MKGKRKITFIFILGSAAVASFFLFIRKDARTYDVSSPKSVTIDIDGYDVPFPSIDAGTVGELIGASGMDISTDDDVIPARETTLSSGMTVFVWRSKTISVKADGNVRDIRTTARTVVEALDGSGIPMKDEDLVVPDRSKLLSRSGKIVVTRVEIREESADKKIAFQTQSKEDDTLSWRKKITRQKGENGIRTYRYRVSYHDGKEVARKLLGSEVTKDPVPEIIVQGTYVKVGKAQNGMGTWYSYTGKLAAASLSLPLGSYARVTNPSNGKSVIVVINDRGPYGKGRIIDLDKVAFEEIASIGAGVIDVKVEPVLN
ncbi:MAG: G5 domain-containing protein [Candidatus Moraniibacteriota bacterium]